MLQQIAEVTQLRPEQYVTKAKELGAPVDLVRMVARRAAAGRELRRGRAGHAGRRSADDAARRRRRLRRLGHLQVRDPAPRARAIVEATTHFNDPEILAKVSHGLGEPMPGSRSARSPPVCRTAAGSRGRCRGEGRCPRAQGDFREHIRVSRRGRRASPSRSNRRRELADVDRLVIPGGESTTMAKLARAATGRARPGACADGMPVLGTCAGMIVLAERVLDGEPLFCVMDVTVRRNAYGRQVDSFEADVDVDGHRPSRTRRVHPGSRGSRTWADVRVLAATRAGRGAASRGTSSSPPSIPSSSGRPRSTSTPVLTR